MHDFLPPGSENLDEPGTGGIDDNDATHVVLAMGQVSGCTPSSAFGLEASERTLDALAEADGADIADIIGKVVEMTSGFAPGLVRELVDDLWGRMADDGFADGMAVREGADCTATLARMLCIPVFADAEAVRSIDTARLERCVQRYAGAGSQARVYGSIGFNGIALLWESPWLFREWLEHSRSEGRPARIDEASLSGAAEFDFMPAGRGRVVPLRAGDAKAKDAVKGGGGGGAGADSPIRLPGRYFLVGCTIALRQPDVARLFDAGERRGALFENTRLPIFGKGPPQEDMEDAAVAAAQRGWQEEVTAWLARDPASAGMRHAGTPAVPGGAFGSSLTLFLAKHLHEHGTGPGMVQEIEWEAHTGNGAYPGTVDLAVRTTSGIVQRVPLPQAARLQEERIGLLLGCDFGAEPDDDADETPSTVPGTDGPDRRRLH